MTQLPLHATAINRQLGRQGDCMSVQLGRDVDRLLYLVQSMRQRESDMNAATIKMPAISQASRKKKSA